MPDLRKQYHYKKILKRRGCFNWILWRNLRGYFASFGGWIPFGPERVITKSKGNILYEIDGQPALNLYKTI
jgi:hypothetical protein